VDVTVVEVVGEHRLRLTFEDGTVGDLDFSGREWRGVLEPLGDPACFAGVQVDPEAGTILQRSAHSHCERRPLRIAARMVAPTFGPRLGQSCGEIGASTAPRPGAPGAPRACRAVRRALPAARRSGGARVRFSDQRAAPATLQRRPEGLRGLARSEDSPAPDSSPATTVNSSPEVGELPAHALRSQRAPCRETSRGRGQARSYAMAIPRPSTFRRVVS
jgi:hypothetical protein